MDTNTKTRTTRFASIALSLLLVGGAIVAVAGPVSAHDCTALNPATTCGACVSGNHHHTFTTGTIYCSSSEPPLAY